MDDLSRKNLEPFFIESDEIENIRNLNGVEDQVLFFIESLDLDFMTLDVLVRYVKIVQPDAELRSKPGMDVHISAGPGKVHYYPPLGGVLIRQTLENYLLDISYDEEHPFKMHQKYEHLHPMTDGNGRSGRFLWLWQMWKYYGYRAELRFLEKWYRHSLSQNLSAKQNRE